MSDGPHRSLKLRKAWKKVAEVADNVNFGSSHVAELIYQAVIQDLKKDVPPQSINLIKTEFEDRESNLFPEYRKKPLEEFEQKMLGSPMCRPLLDCMNYELKEGHVGQQGLTNAVESFSREWMQRMARQIEEHYRRHPMSTMARTINIRDRIQEAIQSVPIDEIAQQTLGLKPPRPSRVEKRSGLDEGVPFK